VRDDARPPAGGHAPTTDPGDAWLLAGGGDPPALTPRREYIDDPALVGPRVRSLVANRVEAHIRLRAGNARARVSPSDDPDYPIRVHTTTRPPPGPVVIQLVGHTSVYRAVCERFRRHEDTLLLSLPERLLRMQNRTAPRVAAPAGTTLSFTHPSLPDKRVVRPVRDVSREGCGFPTRPDDELHAGLLLRDVMIRFPSGPALHFTGGVRAISHGRNGEMDTTGLHLAPASDEDAVAWYDRIGDLLIPSTRVGGTWSEHLWELYEASGYFSLSGKSPPHFRQLRSPFANVVRKLDEAPEIGCQTVWPSERGVEASLALLKIYQPSWFAFQLAKRPGDPPGGVPGKVVLRSVHMRAYEHAQLDSDLRWIVALVQDSARWSKLVYYDLPARYVHTGLSAVVPVQVYEIDLHEPHRARQSRWHLGDATPKEVAEFLAFLSNRRPTPYLEALDYVPARFDLRAVQSAWTRAGLTRERTVHVARRGDRVVAVAVLESADPGLHLFGLLDMVRLFEVEPGGAAAFHALVDRARAWYGRRARTIFTCVVEEGDVETRPDIRHLGHASLTIFSTDLLPSFLEHILEVTAPRFGE
jgi:hypothetical protein